MLHLKRKEGRKEVCLFRCKPQKVINTYINTLKASKKDWERAYTARRISALRINYAAT